MTKAIQESINPVELYWVVEVLAAVKDGRELCSLSNSKCELTALHSLIPCKMRT